MTAKEKVETSIHAAVRNVAKLPDETPKEKVSAIVQRVTLGVAVCFLGWTGLEAKWNEWLVVGIFFVGGNLISNQLLVGAAKKVTEPIAALFKAIRGGHGA